MPILVSIAEAIVMALDSTLFGPLLVGKRYSIWKLLLFTVFAGTLFLGAISVSGVEPGASNLGFWVPAIFSFLFAIAAVVQFAGLTWEYQHKEKRPEYEIPAWLETLSWFVAPDSMSWFWLRKQYPSKSAGVAIGFLGVLLSVGLWLFNELWPGWLWWVLGSAAALAWLFTAYCYWHARRNPGNKRPGDSR